MSSRYFWPLMLIAAGVLFLLDNLNLLPGSAWSYFWPVFLIAAGLGLLLGWRGTRAEPVDDSLEREGASSATLTFKHGAGELRVGSGAAPHLLWSGTFHGGVDKRVDRHGAAVDVVLTSPADWTQWFGSWTGNALDWNVALNGEVPLALKFETGASRTLLDLAELRVTDLRVNTGASATEVTLPANAGFTRARLESGAASVTVRVPPGVAARIRGAMGVGTLDVDQARFTRVSGGYESPDYATAANKAEIEVHGGVGTVNVR